MKNLSEATQVKPIQEHTDKLPVGVLARVTYPICNIDVLNHNNRMYPKEVFEKVLGDQDICEKIQTRTLFGDSEHPENGTATRLEKDRVSHIVSKIWLDEAKKQVFATLDILNTEPGKFLNTLLLAECQVGVSTRAEGELEEAIDESTGDKYYRVLPEAYQFKTVDFTADPSTLGALPENITYNSVLKIREGVNEGRIDINSAKSVLKNFKSKEAVQLYESLNSGSDNMPKEIKVEEGKVPNPTDQDTKVVDALVEKTIKEDEEHKEHEESETPEQEAAEHGVAPDPDPVVPEAPIVPEVPMPEIPPVVEPVASQVAAVADAAKAALDKAVELVAKAEDIANADGGVVPPAAPEVPMAAPDAVVPDAVPPTLVPAEEGGDEEEEVLGEAIGGEDTTKIGRKEKKAKETYEPDKAYAEQKRKEAEEKAKKAEMAESKLKALRAAYIQESQTTMELRAKLKEVTETTVKALEDKIKVNERAVANSLKKIVALEKVNEALKKDNEALKKINEGNTEEKRAIQESINREVVKRYTKHLIESSGYSVPENTRAILESCGNEEEVDKLFSQVRTGLNEMSLHSNVINEIKVPNVEKNVVDPEQERIERAVRIAKQGF